MNESVLCGFAKPTAHNCSRMAGVGAPVCNFPSGPIQIISVNELPENTHSSSRSAGASNAFTASIVPDL